MTLKSWWPILKTEARPGAALDAALQLGKGACFLLTPAGEILSWFSTTRTDIASGESFPELDPKHFSFNSPRGWCPVCRGHGRVFPWMLEPEDDEADPLARLRAFGVEAGEEISEAGKPCPQCLGERLNRTSRAVKLHFKGRAKSIPAPLSLPALLRSTPAALLRHLGPGPRPARTTDHAGPSAAD
jgi:excinuclease ABC subunit A